MFDACFLVLCEVIVEIVVEIRQQLISISLHEFGHFFLIIERLGRVLENGRNFFKKLVDLLRIFGADEVVVFH